MTSARKLKPQTDWTDDLIAELSALWDEGHSTAEIGRRLGVTKNAIVGKAHRLNLPARPSPVIRGRTPRDRPKAGRMRRIQTLKSPASPRVTIPVPKTDLTGREFGHLKVICLGEPILRNSRGKRWKASAWICQCECGRSVTVAGDDLRSGKRVWCSRWNHQDTIRVATRQTKRNFRVRAFNHTSGIDEDFETQS